MTDDDSIIPDKMLTSMVSPTDRNRALRDIAFEMKEITNHMTGLMYMFAKLNEQYYALGLLEQIPEGDPLLQPVRTHEVQSTSPTPGMFTITVTETAESPIGPLMFSGIAHNEKGVHNVHGTITQVED
jgi:hypothetical protein